MREISLKEHQTILLEMMIEFDAYCERHALRYFIAGGTLIGAVRHKGFIPWDDDVDIVMPRPDYEKLLEQSSISDRIDVVSYRNPGKYNHPFCPSVLADKSTIMREEFVKTQTNKGVFCDIFPIDGIPDDPIDRKRHLNRLMRLESILGIRTSVAPGFSNPRDSVKSILSIMLGLTDPVKTCEKIDRLAMKYGFEESEYVVQSVALFRHPEWFIAPKSDFSDSVPMEFEGAKLKAPKGYDAILARQYGDYMAMPPIEERHGAHGVTIFKREND